MYFKSWVVCSLGRQKWTDVRSDSPEEQKTLRTQRQAAALRAFSGFCRSKPRTTRTASAFCAFRPIWRSEGNKKMMFLFDIQKMCICNVLLWQCFAHYRIWEGKNTELLAAAMKQIALVWRSKPRSLGCLIGEIGISKGQHHFQNQILKKSESF